MYVKRWFIFLLLILCPILGFSAIYPLPASGNDIIGHVFTAKAQIGDTLGSIGLRYGMSLHEMMEANPGISMNNKLRAGQKITIPAEFILPPFRSGIVVNMAELRMYYFPPGGKYVMTFPVAMGRDQWRTPTIATKVVSKEQDPVWRVPDSIREWTFENKGELLPEEVPPGPDNPLGPYALHLAANGYLIHGNNSATSIGKFVSSGCIRMNNADITTLFNIVKIGTPVYIIHYPYKAGWYNGDLYLEAQVPVALEQEPSGLNQISLQEVIDSELRLTPGVVDWSVAQQIANQHNGVPQIIGKATAGQVTYESHPPLPIHTPDGTGLDLLLSSDQPEMTQNIWSPNSNWEVQP